MERRLIGLGVVAGLVAGLGAFAFSRVQIAPLIDQAVTYEDDRSHAVAALTGEHGHGHEVFSRGIQENVGAAVGTTAFAVVLGALFAVACTVVMAMLRRRRLEVGPGRVAAGVAGVAFIAVGVLPLLAYPPNPPGVGQADSAGARTLAYLALLTVSVAAAWIALAIALRLTQHMRPSQAGVACALGYSVVMAVTIGLLPSFDEIPGPLTDPSGAITFAGFPAGLLADYRISTLAVQAVMWAGIGIVFGLAAPRVVATQTEAVR